MQAISVPSSLSLDLHGAVLVTPAVAYFNIGELAIDLLIHNLDGTLVARLDDENVLACVGNNPYNPDPPGQLATALELYQVPGSKVFLLQQRAPAIPGRQQAFAERLAAWATGAGISHLLLLCGLDAQYRRDEQLEGPQLRFLAGRSSAAPRDTTAAAARSSQPDLQQQQQQQTPGPFDASCLAAGLLRLEQQICETEREVHALLPPWPLLDAAAAAALGATLITTFAAEGDNTQDGIVTAAAALAVLRHQGLLPAAPGAQHEQQWRLPCSWQGLYGDQTSKLLC